MGGRAVLVGGGAVLVGDEGTLFLVFVGVGVAGCVVGSVVGVLDGVAVADSCEPGAPGDVGVGVAAATNRVAEAVGVGASVGVVPDSVSPSAKRGD